MGNCSLAQQHQFPAQTASKRTPRSQGENKSGDNWIATEAKNILEQKQSETEKFSEKFSSLLKKFDNDGDLRVSRNELQHGFEEMNIDMEPQLLDKIFELFDSDGDGTVNYQEFTVTMLFMLYSQPGEDSISLAFHVFDSNQNGCISRKEFNDMIVSVIGTRLENLLRIEQWRTVFEDHLEKEFSSESIRFWKAVERLEEKKTISIAEARKVAEQFILDGSEMEVNIDHVMKDKVLTAIANSGDELSWEIFKKARDEVLKLMERDSFSRFRKELRTNYKFATTVFERLDDPHAMSLQDFRTWAEQTPGVFQFLDDLRNQLRSWLD